MKLNQVTVAVSDIDRAILFYEGLGLDLIVKAPHYARFEVSGNFATFSIEKTERVLPSATVIYFEIEHLDTYVAALEAKGYVFDQEPIMQSWLWYEARLKDPDGNEICLYFAGENRLNPPWRLKKE